MSDQRLSCDSGMLAEIETRNKFRREYGLPPVDVQQELERARQVREREKFEQWMQSPLRYRVEQKLLLRIRRQRSNPTWTPTGMLSGGGWAFHAALVKQMRRLRARLDK